MRQCTYIYQPLDESVVKGKVKDGDRCINIGASLKTRDLCGGHFKQWNVKNDPEANKKITEKQKASMLKNQAKTREKHKEVVEGARDLMSEQTNEILRVLGKNEKYDLKYEYSLLLMLNSNPETEKYSEKYAFAMWLNTPEPMRTPKEMSEVEGILGVSKITLALWRRSPELVHIFNEKVKECAARSYIFTLEKLLEQVAIGNTQCIQVSLKHAVELMNKEQARPNFPTISKELVEQAKKGCDNGTANKLENVANQVSKAAAYDAILKGNVKPNDTVQ